VDTKHFQYQDDSQVISQLSNPDSDDETVLEIEEEAEEGTHHSAKLIL
jgi:hypothetical protein